MARKRNAKLENFGFSILAFGIVLMIGVATLPILIPVFIIGFIIHLYLTWPRHCGICGNQLRRTSYIWNFQNVKKRICPHCNQRLEREQSRNAFNKLK